MDLDQGGSPREEVLALQAEDSVPRGEVLGHRDLLEEALVLDREALLQDGILAGALPCLPLA